MIVSNCPQNGTEASASLVALAVSLLITTLAVGCLTLVTGAMSVSQKRPVPANAVTLLAWVASRVALALTDNPAADPGRLERLADQEPEYTVRLRDRSDAFGGIGTPDPFGWHDTMPINPVVANPHQVERVYAERTGSAERARAFVSDIAQRVATGTQLRETDIREAAGIDYPNIVGLITGEPILNVNTAPAALLRRLPEDLAPDDPDTRAAVSAALGAMVDGLLSVREGRAVTAGELASMIETVGQAAAAWVPAAGVTPAGTAQLLQHLTAWLGVRTWMWELTVEHLEWVGTATIAHLPGHPKAVILGLTVEPAVSEEY